MFKVGDRVKRNAEVLAGKHGISINSSWCDGGNGNLGTVEKVLKEGVGVRWDMDISKKLIEFYRDHMDLLVKVNEVNVDEDDDKSKLNSLKEITHAIYADQLYSDYTIVCQDGDRNVRIPCHKNFLASSEYFAGLFESGMKETHKEEVEIIGYSGRIIEHFIKYFYINEVDREVMTDNAETFLKLADQFRVSGLKKQAANLMKASISKSNVLEMILAGYHFNAPDLKTVAMNYAAQNKEVYLENKEEWKTALAAGGRHDLLLELVEILFGGSLADNGI